MDGICLDLDNMSIIWNIDSTKLNARIIIQFESYSDTVIQYLFIRIGVSSCFLHAKRALIVRRQNLWLKESLLEYTESKKPCSNSCDIKNTNGKRCSVHSSDLMVSTVAGTTKARKCPKPRPSRKHINGYQS